MARVNEARGSQVDLAKETGITWARVCQLVHLSDLSSKVKILIRKDDEEGTGECYETALEYQECNSRTKDCFYNQCIAGVCLPLCFLGEACSDMEKICRHSQCILGECRREKSCDDGG